MLKDIKGIVQMLFSIDRNHNLSRIPVSVSEYLVVKKYFLYTLQNLGKFTPFFMSDISKKVFTSRKIIRLNNSSP